LIKLESIIISPGQEGRMAWLDVPLRNGNDGLTRVQASVQMAPQPDV
jgi:hypothetical protein